MLHGGDYRGTPLVFLIVRDSTGANLAEAEEEADFERQQPNGPGCPPGCWFARVELYVGKQ